MIIERRVVKHTDLFQLQDHFKSIEIEYREARNRQWDVAIKGLKNIDWLKKLGYRAANEVSPSPRSRSDHEFYTIWHKPTPRGKREMVTGGAVTFETLEAAREFGGWLAERILFCRVRTEVEEKNIIESALGEGSIYVIEDHSG